MSAESKRRSAPCTCAGQCSGRDKDRAIRGLVRAPENLAGANSDLNGSPGDFTTAATHVTMSPSLVTWCCAQRKLN